MKNIFNKGDKKVFSKVVYDSDIAKFDSGKVHNVCSTFSLAQAIEWSSRLFVLDMKEDDEEGIGTMLTINHKSPALVGNRVDIIVVIESIIGNEVICNYQAKVNERIIAEGKTGQKILKKQKIERLFERIDGEKK